MFVECSFKGPFPALYSFSSQHGIHVFAFFFTLLPWNLRSYCHSLLVICPYQTWEGLLFMFTHFYIYVPQLTMLSDTSLYIGVSAVPGPRLVSLGRALETMPPLGY